MNTNEFPIFAGGASRGRSGSLWFVIPFGGLRGGRDRSGW